MDMQAIFRFGIFIAIANDYVNAVNYGKFYLFCKTNFFYFNLNYVSTKSTNLDDNIS